MDSGVAWAPLARLRRRAAASALLPARRTRSSMRRRSLADLRYDFTHLRRAHGIDVGPGWYAHLTRSLPYGCGLLIFAAAIAGMVVAWRRRRGHGVVLVRVRGGVSRRPRQRPHGVLPLRHAARAAGVRVRGRDGGRTWRGDGARAGGSARAWRRSCAGLVIGAPSLVEQPLDGRPAGANRHAHPRRAVAARAAAAGAFRLRRGRDLRPARPARRELSRLDLRSAHAVVRRPRWQDAALAGDPGVAAAPLRAARAGDPASGRWSATHPSSWRAGRAVLDSAAVYDRQDAFFMPFSRFWEVERPGPTITVYRRSE